jgi:hypothetical protein
MSIVRVAKTYRISGWLGCGLVSIGSFCMYSFSASKTSCCYGPQSKVSEPLNALKNGKLQSTIFAINRFSAAIPLVSFCTSFLDPGGFMWTIAFILSGLALIPFTDTK